MALALPAPASPEACPAVDEPAAAPAAPGAAIRVYVDPATGRIRRPTSEERRRVVVASRDRAGRTYEVRTRPDGTRLVALDEAFLMSVFATVGPDGKVSYRCGTNPAPSGSRPESAE